MDSDSDEITIITINKNKRKTIAPRHVNKRVKDIKVRLNKPKDNNTLDIKNIILTKKNNTIIDNIKNVDTIATNKELIDNHIDTQQSSINTLLVHIKQKDITTSIYVNPTDMLRVLYTKNIVKEDSKIRYKNVLVSKYTSFRSIKHGDLLVIEEINVDYKIKLIMECDRKIDILINKYKKINDILEVDNQYLIGLKHKNIILLLNGKLLNQNDIINNILEDNDLIDIIVL